MSLSFPLQASQDAPVGVVTAGEEADEDEEGEEDAVTVVVEAEREEQGQTQNKGDDQETQRKVKILFSLIRRELSRSLPLRGSRVH